MPRRSVRSTERADSPGDLEAARDHVLGLGFARRYGIAPLRWSGDRDGDRIVRLTDSGRVCRLNATAGLLLDRLAEGTVGDAAVALAERHPSLPSRQLELDTVRTVRWLASRGVLTQPDSTPVGSLN